MNKIIIPSSFELGPHTISVELDSPELMENRHLGTASFDTCQIKVATEILVNNRPVDLPKSQTEHAFFHELVHMILMSMNEEELNKNEQFIDNFSSYLLQYLKTADYKNPAR